MVHLLLSWVNPAGLKKNALQSSASPRKQLPMAVDLAPTVPICVPLLAKASEIIPVVKRTASIKTESLRIIFSSRSLVRV